MPHFLFIDFHLNLLFNFKVGPLLDLSRLMSMFNIILINGIIKTTCFNNTILILINGIIKTMCFNNTILMAEVEVKLLQSRWSLSVHNFHNCGFFHKIFGMCLQKNSAYLCTQKFLPSLLYFWNYNPSFNGQIISLIGAQAHL